MGSEGIETFILEVVRSSLNGKTFRDNSSPGKKYYGKEYTVDDVSITSNGRKILMSTTYENGERFPILLEDHYVDILVEQSTQGKLSFGEWIDQQIDSWPQWKKDVLRARTPTSLLTQSAQSQPKCTDDVRFPRSPHIQTIQYIRKLLNMPSHQIGPKPRANLPPQHSEFT